MISLILGQILFLFFDFTKLKKNTFHSNYSKRECDWNEKKGFNFQPNSYDSSKLFTPGNTPIIFIC